MGNSQAYVLVQRYESEERALAGKQLLNDAGITCSLEVTKPETVYAAFTPDARIYLLKVPSELIKQAHHTLYQQEPVERPEKDWQFRDPSVRSARKSGLRNLMLGAALACASMAIGLATYLMATGPHYLMAVASFAGSIFLIAKGWRQLRKKRAEAP